MEFYGIPLNFMKVNFMNSMENSMNWRNDFRQGKPMPQKAWRHSRGQEYYKGVDDEK
jgi:hypothetical protein